MGDPGLLADTCRCSFLFFFSTLLPPSRSFPFFQAFHLLKQLDPEFVKQFVPRRELLFLDSLPVTANSHRAMETSHPHADGPQLSFVSWIYFYYFLSYT